MLVIFCLCVACRQETSTDHIAIPIGLDQCDV